MERNEASGSRRTFSGWWGGGLLEQGVKVEGGTTDIETGQILIINFCVLLH